MSSGLRGDYAIKSDHNAIRYTVLVFCNRVHTVVTESESNLMKQKFFGPCGPFGHSMTSMLPYLEK